VTRAAARKSEPASSVDCGTRFEDSLRRDFALASLWKDGNEDDASGAILFDPFGSELPISRR